MKKLAKNQMLPVFLGETIDIRKLVLGGAILEGLDFTDGDPEESFKPGIVGLKIDVGHCSSFRVRGVWVYIISNGQLDKPGSLSLNGPFPALIGILLVMKLTAENIQIYEKLLSEKQEEGLYRSIIGAGIIRSSKIPCPEVEILNTADAFFSLFRRSGKEEYFIIGKTLRRAAHKLYRELRKMDDKRPDDNRFLRLVAPIEDPEDNTEEK